MLPFLPSVRRLIMSRSFVAVSVCWAQAFLVAATSADDGWTPLFNGKDLSGWVIVNVAPTTFSVRDGIIVSTGKPTGTMRTERMYENFIMELEWRHLQKGGN